MRKKLLKTQSKNSLKLRFGIAFEDLYEREGLLKLNQKFEKYLKEKNSEIAAEFSNLKTENKVRQSQILIEAARILEDFLVELFGVEKENAELKKQHEELKKIYFVRREFVQREIAKKFQDAAGIDGIKLLEGLKISFADVDDLEKKLTDEILARKNPEILEKYSAWALYSKEGQKLHKNGALFILPRKIDHQNLINKTCENSKRDGFDLTDKGFSLNRSLAEAHYCIFCHNQEKDSCRSGILEKRPFDDALTHFAQRPKLDYKIDPLGVELHGCPLDEKISEMNLLKSEGFSLAALAIACVDNPMIAGTGHRICNDCMKSCIFQKQDPVDIPQVETRTLKDVLALPFGFEIYSLLTRFNPLNFEKKLPLKTTRKKILVVGLGPAGYTLAHHLLNDGHEVVAIDGLKIEPLNSEISGVDIFGKRKKFKPIKFLDEIYEPLSNRLIQGFGGVAEYGITVRWDKNYLKIIRLLLERRKNFSMFGGIRFGSSITEETAFDDYGFDHVALCIGAGRPNIINLKNNFAKGIRAASDFLMSLQLTGSFKENLFTNLQIRMPILVVGGGLTAVDTACEAQAYYITQIKKFALQLKKIGKEKVFSALNEEEKNIAEEFLQHAKELEQSDLQELLKKWGGVKILYRKKIQDSPAYRLNHQELQKALEEGIEFIENVTPLEAALDEFNHIKNLKCADRNFACRSLLVAAGTTPNLSPKLEDNLDFEIDGKYFAEINSAHKHFAITHSARPKEFSVITKIDETSKKAVSFFGDLHPNFEGNVVKAMASAKLGHHQITEILQHLPKSKKPKRDFAKDFLVKIEKIEKLSNHVFEVSVKAPLFAAQTKLGHIFRLQNYHALAKKRGDQILAMEGVTMTALSSNPETGIIKGVMIVAGASTSLIKNFKKNEACIFMGPSGKPTEIAQNKNVLLIGGGRGNLPLAEIAKVHKKEGCKVIFFAGYKKNEFVVRQKEMENCCDEMVFAIEEKPNLKLNKALSRIFHGSVIDALKNYFSQSEEKIEHIFTIGNDQMMHEIAKLRHQNEILAKAPVAITSLNAPMQCMMKGVCSQCLQKRKNEKGEFEYFYSCAQQDQNMDRLDFAHLHNRCEQNSLSEKISKLWVEQI